MVAGKGDHLPVLHELADLEGRLTHLYAEAFRLVAPRHHTPVVVAEHHYGFPLQGGVERAFTRYKEIIAVGESGH